MPRLRVCRAWLPLGARGRDLRSPGSTATEASAHGRPRHRRVSGTAVVAVVVNCCCRGAAGRLLVHLLGVALGRTRYARIPWVLRLARVTHASSERYFAYATGV